jgi:UDPglucose 6-dehydrogenase
MKLAVVGSGYVGLVAGLCFAELGHDVTIVDNDPEKISLLQQGQLPIHEEFLAELLTCKRDAGKVKFTASIAEALEDCCVIFVAVGTPPKENGEADLSFIEEVVRTIAQHALGYVVIVEKSTVPVLTHAWIRKIMALNGAAHDSFDVVSNPEFLREGTAVLDFLYPDRIVIGADTERSANLVSEIYLPLTSGEYHSRKTALPAPNSAIVPSNLIVTSAKSAELIKHASNAFLATKISFINAVASICESVGADVQEVCKGMGADARIGSRFLNPGIGYGGSCFPKDLTAFRSVAHESGYEFALLDQVISINEQQRARFLRKIRQALWNLKNKRLAVLGLAFKGGTDDIRESPALEIVKSLVEEGAVVTAFDPAAMERTKAELGDSISYVDSAYAACEEADALLILTDWAEFAQLDLKRLKEMLRYPIIVDGRNLYDPAAMKDAGIQYYSVGRPAVVQSSKTLKATAAKTTT